jgi:hypothetical protein
VQLPPAESKRGQCVQCKAFLPGHQTNTRHGLRRNHTAATLPEDLRQSVEEFRTALISDQGGLEELSAVRAGLIRLLVGAEVAHRIAGSELQRQGGIHTPNGRLAFDRLMTATQTWTRVAERLGIERRTRQLPSPVEWMRGEAEIEP